MNEIVKTGNGFIYNVGGMLILTILGGIAVSTISRVRTELQADNLLRSALDNMDSEKIAKTLTERVNIHEIEI